jgi:methionyl-tRNA synthetase
MAISKSDTFYVTTPIYYVNAKPHLGSLYSTLLADVAARWNMLQGKKTFLLTGTDEHGQKVAEAAEKARVTPQLFVDSFVPAFKDLWHLYDINYNFFIRTTDDSHKQAIQQWIAKLIEQGDIYKSYYTGWYCTACETFVTEKEGTKSPQENPFCPSCARPTAPLSEESYFFRLSAYQEQLLNFYKENPDFITPPERTHEILNFVQAGLKDLSISRTTITWGIPFPNDAAHITYVWADALNNYITAIGYGNPARQNEFESWWPANLQVLGKDILRFHAVYWPAFLMASNLPLPHQLLVHGWIKVGDQKMSKSLGNAIDPVMLAANYGVDTVRYYLTRHMAITHDSSFSIEDLAQRNNADLAHDLGNLLNRMLILAQKNGITVLEAPEQWSGTELELRDNFWTILNEINVEMESYFFHRAYALVWKFINSVNAYFHAQEPWKLAQTNSVRFREVLSATAHSLYALAILIWPVMPSKMAQLLASLGMSLDTKHNVLEQLSVEPWHKTFTLTLSEPLFNRIELPKEQEQLPTDKIPELSQNFITIEDFSAIELRVGTIIECEMLPKSEKLYKLQVDFGPFGIRQVCSGVRHHFTPELLLQRQGIFVFNLKPRTIMGLESYGMMLFAPNAEGKFQLPTVVNNVPNGTRLQ